MKSVAVFLPLLAYAAPTQDAESTALRKRQIFSFAGNAVGPPKIATVLKTLTPEIDAKATRVIKMWGPFKLLAANASHGTVGLSDGIKLDANSDTIGAVISPPCSDCTVLKATANLAYKDGRQADVASGVYTHHIIMAQNGRMQLPNPVSPPSNCLSSLATSVLSGFLPKGPAAAPAHGHGKRQEIPSWLAAFIPKSTVFVGGGGSVGSGGAFAVPSQVSSVHSGAYIAPSDTFKFSSEIVNYDNFEKDIYLTLDFEWVPGKVEKLLDVGMGSVGLDCTSFAFQPPKDKPFTYQGGNWTMTQNGYFVGFTPHLHDGGVNIKVFLNEQEICESRAEYGADNGVATLEGGKKWETITGYTPCLYMKQFKVGDQIRMTSDYDLTKHILRPNSKNHDMEAEGMALATFIWASGKA